MKNNNMTLGSQLKNFLYKIVGNNAAIIGTTSTALVLNTGMSSDIEEHVEQPEPQPQPQPPANPGTQNVTLTYVTDPSKYPSNLGNLYLDSIKKCATQMNARLTKDISEHTITVPTGTQIKITSEEPTLTPSNSNDNIIFVQWFKVKDGETGGAGFGYNIERFEGNNSYNPIHITLNEDTTLYAYYAFSGSVNWHKPVLYLYPTEETTINVKVGYEDRLTTTYPKYNSEGWKVLARPDGTLKDLATNRELYCLYYEANNYIDLDIYKDGFVVKGEDSAVFLEEKLDILGLTEREAQEFIIYWLPKLEANKYNYIRFAQEEYINDNMPLEITPKPDTLIRVLMEFKGLEEPIDIQEQKLTTPVREGYTVVEWGGTEIM